MVFIPNMVSRKPVAKQAWAPRSQPPRTEAKKSLHFPGWNIKACREEISKLVGKKYSSSLGWNIKSLSGWNIKSLSGINIKSKVGYPASQWGCHRQTWPARSQQGSSTACWTPSSTEIYIYFDLKSKLKLKVLFLSHLFSIEIWIQILLKSVLHWNHKIIIFWVMLNVVKLHVHIIYR